MQIPLLSFPFVVSHESGSNGLHTQQAVGVGGSGTAAKYSPSPHEDPFVKHMDLVKTMSPRHTLR